MSDRSRRLHNLAYYIPYASKIYGKIITNVYGKAAYLELLNGKTGRDFTIEELDITPNQLIFENWTSEEMHPAYFVFVDPYKQKIILSIRGTLNFYDFMTDIRAELLPLTVQNITGLAH